MSTRAPERLASSPGTVVAALGALYLIWGSTYLAIRIALEGFPPLTMAGSRFVLAGGLLYAVARRRGSPRPGAAEWRSGALVGSLLCAANGLVTVSEQWVSSSVAAVVVASVPLWAVLAALLWRERPALAELAGLAVGLAGVVLLQAGGDLRAHPLGAALLVLSTWSWALGSMWSRRLPMPAGLMAPATEMLAGGALLLGAGILRGERLASLPGARPLAAWAFLALFGSLVAFTAYNFLLRRVRPALATSYAYVNPAVAVLLGALYGETVGPRELVALALILGGVGIVAVVRRPAPARADPAASRGDAP
ncbi:MAG TPA: drug/metabolite exporter YedA [Anaeromyxobacteraceae bacterium]|nr:drug/metabolite exporter YedA [Anaeromyxobacteraceae bacterium]